jgi:hypothetical protein
MWHRDWLALGVPAGEATRAAKFQGAERRALWILAPALEPAEHPAAVDEAAAVVDGVPLQQKAGLLVGVLPRLTGVVAVRLTKELAGPGQGLSSGGCLLAGQSGRGGQARALRRRPSSRSLP